MRVVAFRGSPRRGGNSDMLLDEALRGAGDGAEVFSVNDMKIAPCQNCGGCDRTGVCVIDDGMGAVYEALRGADRVVMASPIFFMGITAQMKALIDRCQAFWCEKYLLGREIPAGEHGRKGLVLLVGGMKRDAGIECAKTCATAFLRTISVPEHTTLAYKGVDVKGDIAKHPTALSEAFEAGRALVA